MADQITEASLKLGGDWATKEGSLLGYNDQNGNYKPIPFDFTRATTATRVNRDGLIEEVQSGVPRIDFLDNPDGALLLEPQRTNIFTYSENFNGADWILQTATITDNAAISPEGIQNASLYTTSTDLYDFVRQNISFVSGTTYTYSVFAKQGTSSLITLAYNNLAFGTDQSVEFDLSDGTYTINSGSPSVKMEDYGNGWYRCAITATATASVTRTTGFSSTAAGSVTTLYLYGAQMEVGSYATSYIKTSGSAVTRNEADCVTASPSTSLFGQTEGTIYTEIKIKAITSGLYSRVFNLKNSSGSNQIYFQQNDSRIIGVVFNGSNQFSAGTSSGFLSVGSTYKIAMAYKNADYALYINGIQIGTGSASGLGTLAVDRADLTTGTGNIGLGNETKNSLVYNTRLTNTQLAELTTI